MKVTAEHNESVAKMKFSSVYPHYVTKIEKKGRSIEELHEVIKWLTGYDELRLLDFIKGDQTFQEFFESGKLNPMAQHIKGVICGYRIEDIDNALTQKVRFLDKLVDELSRGRKMEKILR